MRIAERRIVETEQKLAGLEGELAAWLGQAAGRKPLRKHNSQLRRVTEHLGGMRERIARELGDVRRRLADGGDAGAALADCWELERMTLEAYRIWEFFRSKFAQRHTEWYTRYLAAADDFAWACYSAAQTALRPSAATVKEPPLVFLNGGSSPFTMSREVEFEAEYVPGEGLSTPEFRDVCRSLPVPVIGVPWSHVNHLPDLVILGHEVGHNVEDDFGLTGRLEEVLDRALRSARVPDGRRDAWRAWLGEVFADVYGCLASGPAFVSALADFLAGDSAEIAGERPARADWGLYPTAWLRVALNLAVLERLEFGDDAAAIRAAWTEFYPSHAMPEFEPDTAIVAKALLDGPYPAKNGAGGVRLSGVLAFEPTAHARASRDAGALLTKKTPTATDVRVLVASARIAFAREAETYLKDGRATNLVLSKIEAVRPGGTRSAAAPAGPTDDAGAGAALFDRVRGSLGQRRARTR